MWALQLHRSLCSKRCQERYCTGTPGKHTFLANPPTAFLFLFVWTLDLSNLIKTYEPRSKYPKTNLVGRGWKWLWTCTKHCRTIRPQKKKRQPSSASYSWWSILASLDCRDPKPFYQVKRCKVSHHDIVYSTTATHWSHDRSCFAI